MNRGGPLMNKLIVSAILGAILLSGSFGNSIWGAELKVIQTRKTKDVVMTLLSESGQWTQGKNSLVLEFTLATTQQPLDVGKVTLSTTMSMPGMAPMVADATLSPDKVPGRYLGTITFPDSGTRQVSITWEGPAGKGSTRLSIPVR
jgi:hypothetical protein